MTGVLRVMTYNVRSLRDDADAVVDVIRSVRPDVVCLQELPRFWRWRTKRRRLAQRCGLRVVAGTRRAVAVGVLARPDLAVTTSDEYVLSRTPGLHLRSVAVVQFADPALVVASLHLGLREHERLRHLREIDALLAGRPPVILGGDVNDRPGTVTWDAVTAGRLDAGPPSPTFPARAPRRRIDGIFVDPSWRVVEAHVVSGAAVSRASDHLPVVADLTPVVSRG